MVKACGGYLITGDIHNNAFQCDRFPDSNNPNVCVNVDSGK